MEECFKRLVKPSSAYIFFNSIHKLETNLHAGGVTRNYGMIWSGLYSYTCTVVEFMRNSQSTNSKRT